MIQIKISENPYIFDTDQNGFPTFTSKNIALSRALVSNDSNYRIPEDTDSDAYKSCYVGLLEAGIPQSYAQMLEVVKAIDKYNSTHLSSEGKKDPRDPLRKMNMGRERTAERIIEIKDIGERILHADPTLVAEIATAVEGRVNFSFATKFCAYVGRVALGVDNYCIYDSVIEKILPYYAYIYLDGNCEYYRTDKSGNNVSTAEGVFRGRANYMGYRDVVEQIINSVREILGVEMTKENFDTLIWYYYKGDNARIRKAMNVLPKKVGKK